MSETSEKIASEIASSIGRQIDLLVTLALALNGAIAAGALQVALRNSNEDLSPLIIQHKWIIAVTFVIEGLAIIFGYLARNGLIYSMRDGLFTFDFTQENKKVTDEVKYFKSVVIFTQFQYICFMLGVGLLFTFVFANWSLI